MRKMRWVAAVVGVALWAGPAAAALPSSYDLAALGRVNTRVEDQVGAGPCWAFAIMVAAESNVLTDGLWAGDPNALDLSQQFLRCNETQGHLFADPPIAGWCRAVNSGGRPNIGISHMARLDGPITEAQCPYWYTGTFYDSSGYYGPGGEPLWPAAGTYPPAYFLESARHIQDRDAIKQAVIDLGAPYVGIAHYNMAYDAGSNTYYDDGTASGEGLSGHAMNIIGWDDAKVCPRAPSPGAWLVKQSHPTPSSPTTFWVSYESQRFLTGDGASFFDMGPIDAIAGVHYHDMVGAIGSWYLPDECDESLAVCRYVAGPEAEQIGLVSFYSETADQPYEVRLYDSLAALEAGADPLTTAAGIVADAGYYTIDLASPVTIAAGDDFLVYLSLPGGEQGVSYGSDSQKTSEVNAAGECYYFDTVAGAWLDLYDYDQGYQSFTMKAYAIVPEPGTLVLLAFGAVAVAVRKRR